jgi:hypothetical protein
MLVGYDHLLKLRGSLCTLCLSPSSTNGLPRSASFREQQRWKSEGPNSLLYGGRGRKVHLIVADAGMWSGFFMQEDDLINLTVYPHPSNSML